MKMCEYNDLNENYKTSKLLNTQLTKNLRKSISRLFAMSDIHGCLSQFEEMLAKIKFTKNDKLIILGDNIDRGNASIHLVLRLKKLKELGYNIVTLLGNHENMLIEVLEEFDSMKKINASYLKDNLVHNGTYDTLKEYFESTPEIQKAFLDEIKSYKLYHIEDKYLFVHAGVRPGVPLNQQKYDDFIWIREDFVYINNHGLPYTVIFGHTPTRYLDFKGQDEIWFHDKNECISGKIGIDCACVYGGKLACLELTMFAENCSSNSRDKEYYVDGNYVN